MNAEDWARLKIWFGEAASVPPDQRAPILHRLQRESASLAVELESLLAIHESRSLTTLDLTAVSLTQPETPPRTLPPGSLIGPYRVLRELGRGGAGTVFLAERADDEFHRPVALKLLHAAPSADHAPDAPPSGLTRERGSLARMQHGNIAILLDWGTSPEGLPWLATEFIPGQPIDAYCRTRALSQPAILQLFSQVTSAVAYAHARGVVHRDLKPANILVSQEGHSGTVKLLDFGIAQLVESTPDHSVAFRFTPIYASPEQLDGTPATPASDVYSLAVVLGQLLSGTLPPDLARLSPPLGDILRHALQPDPTRRYASVESFQADLHRYTRHQPPQGFRAPWRQRARLFHRRHRVSLALGALLALAALGLIQFRHRFWPAPPSDLSRTPAAIDFFRIPLGSSQTLPLRMDWPRGASVRSVAVVTQGVPNRDFTSSDSSACVGVFSPASSCVIHIRFSPTSGDKRRGAVVFYGQDGAPIATRFIGGVGDNPAGWMPRSQPERIIAGLRSPRGLSTDGRGNAYFIEAQRNTVDEIPAGTDHRRILARMPLPLQGGATAVDGAGNVYFSSTAAHAIYELVNGAPTLIASFPADRLLDDNLTSDAGGNLYASGQDGEIFRISANTRHLVQLYPGGRNHRFVGLDADNDGSLYAPDYLSGALYELPVNADHLLQLLPPGRLHQPHALIVLMGGTLLVGEDVPGAPLIRSISPRYDPLPLPILGNLSLALYGQTRLFAIPSNSELFVYRLDPVSPRPLEP